MKNNFTWIFVRLKGLRHELAFAFGLVMLATLVFLGYLFPGISSAFSVQTHLPYAVFLAVLIVVLAFLWIRQVLINPVINISQRIAAGDYNRQIVLTREDEIGELGDALNRMTSRIRTDMEELKNFGQKTEAINADINKRILSLSGLLQISNLISQNTQLDKIVDVGVERCLSSGEMSLGCLILKDERTNDFTVKTIQGALKDLLLSQDLDQLRIKLGEGLLGLIILKRETLLIDRNSKETAEIRDFRKQFSIVNCLGLPISCRGKTHGILLVGNQKSDYIFSSSDKEWLDLFVKQIAIAIENILLANQVEKLEVIDSLTGLYNHTYIQERLDEEIKRAISFQRPCAFVLFTIDAFQEFHSSFGHLAAENILVKIGTALKENINDVDKAARFGDHEFALILPERNKRQAIDIADSIRRKIEYLFAEEENQQKRLTCTGAVAENPVDGVRAEELVSKARAILTSAIKQGGNRICYKV